MTSATPPEVEVGSASWREGWTVGWTAGHAEGHAEGWTAGWTAGHAAGQTEAHNAQLQQISQLEEDNKLLQEELDKLKSVKQSSPETCVKRARADELLDSRGPTLPDESVRPLLCSLFASQAIKVRLINIPSEEGGDAPYKWHGIYEVLLPRNDEERNKSKWYIEKLYDLYLGFECHEDFLAEYPGGVPDNIIDVNNMDPDDYYEVPPMEQVITGMAAYERGATEDDWLEDASTYLHPANTDRKWLTYIASEEQTPRDVAAQVGCQLALLVKLNRERPCLSSLTFNSALEANTILLVPPADMPHVLSRQRISTVNCDVCLTDTGVSYHCNMCDWDICLNCKASMSAEQLTARQCTSREGEGEDGGDEDSRDEDSL